MSASLALRPHVHPAISFQVEDGSQPAGNTIPTMWVVKNHPAGGEASRDPFRDLTLADICREICTQG